MLAPVVTKSAQITDFNASVRANRLDQMASATAGLSVTSLNSSLTLQTTTPASVAFGNGTPGASPIQATFAQGGNTSHNNASARGGVGAGISWQMGTGGYNTVAGNQAGNGGAYGITGGTGGVSTIAGVETGNGGDVSFTGGPPGSIIGTEENYLGDGGNLNFTAGSCGTVSGGYYNQAGSSGNINFTVPSGGAVSATEDFGGFALVGRDAGNIFFGSVNGGIGVGGSCTAAPGSSDTTKGGIGQGFGMYTKNGGAAVNGSVAVGGPAGGVVLNLGTGGAASGATISNTGGAGGYMDILLGAGGTGATAAGADGFFRVKSSSNASLFRVDNSNSIHIGSLAAHKLGFFGATPIAQAVLATGAGATVDNVITALQNYGIFKQS
jgi:hypothetical protein